MSAEPYSLSITLNGLPMLQKHRRMHWSRVRQHDGRWKHDVWAACLQAGRPTKPLERAQLECIRRSPSEPDYDNLVHSFKPLIDGLVAAHVLLDDNPYVIGQPKYGWEHAAGKGSVHITVMEISG